MILRTVSFKIDSALERGKSLLVLGPRQVGKTTLLEAKSYDLVISFLKSRERTTYEADPDLLISQIEALDRRSKIPRVLVDEIQLVPQLLHAIQYLVDKKMAQFVLTGSSARKLKHQAEVNFNPGRLVLVRMHPLSFEEHQCQKLEDLLNYGELPAIFTEKSKSNKDTDLDSYVQTYLDEEIRKESAAKKLPEFYRFLELAALEAGNIVSLRELGSDSGLSHHTVGSYFQILEDTFIARRVDPFTQSVSRKKLTKSSKYLFFDLGVRRWAAKEEYVSNRDRLGSLFEQYVGLELLRYIDNHKINKRLSFWRDPDGPEVDWLILSNGKKIPIEVKYRETPTRAMCKHLMTFMSEYPEADRAFVICLARRPFKITEQITALPWQNLTDILS